MTPPVAEKLLKEQPGAEPKVPPWPACDVTHFYIGDETPMMKVKTKRQRRSKQKQATTVGKGGGMANGGTMNDQKLTIHESPPPMPTKELEMLPATFDPVGEEPTIGSLPRPPEAEGNIPVAALGGALHRRRIAVLLEGKYDFETPEDLEACVDKIVAVSIGCSAG